MSQTCSRGAEAGQDSALHCSLCLAWPSETQLKPVWKQQLSVFVEVGDLSPPQFSKDTIIPDSDPCKWYQCAGIYNY